MDKNSKKLRAAATKNRGKKDAQEKLEWIKAIDDAITQNPCATALVEGSDGHPTVKPRAYTKKNAWIAEMQNAETGEWRFFMMLNLEKSGNTIRFSHTLKWCMEKLKEEKDFFEKKTWDKCNTRLRNYVTNDVVLAAVLI